MSDCDSKIRTNQKIKVENDWRDFNIQEQVSVSRETYTRERGRTAYSQIDANMQIGCEHAD